jgi:hypothetical protein
MCSLHKQPQSPLARTCVTPKQLHGHTRIAGWLAVMLLSAVAINSVIVQKSSAAHHTSSTSEQPCLPDTHEFEARTMNAHNDQQAIPSVTEPLPSSRNMTVPPPSAGAVATSRSSATCSSYLQGCSQGVSPGAAAAFTCSVVPPRVGKRARIPAAH